MSTHTHLEESLQRDIGQLRNKVLEMAGLAERALKSSVQAFVERNRRLAYSVMLRDQYIDEMETELDRICLEFLVRHQPVGGHLRLIFATIQVNREIERVGDYAESIARQALALGDLQPRPSYARFTELAEIALHMFRDAVQSYHQQDAELARRTMAIEERANNLRHTINLDLAQLNSEKRLPEPALNPLLTIARRLERAADQAKNICEDVLYLCTGEFAKHKGADAFRILFLDTTNSGLGQMAEGIGHSLKLARFVFASAGLRPLPIHPGTVQFLAGKGIDISKQTSKSIEQVPNREHYQVIVALGDEARDTLANIPAKILILTWPIADPASASTEGPVNQGAFESAYLALESNIRDLVGAILDEPQAELSL